VANPTKERLQLLASDVRKSQAEAANSIKELLGLLATLAKDTLVEATSAEEMYRLQGEARVLNRLLLMVTKEPVSIKREGEQQ
jgi:hypothetical protein